MKDQLRRVLALVMSVMMLCGNLPVTALAEALEDASNAGRNVTSTVGDETATDVDDVAADADAVAGDESAATPNMSDDGKDASEVVGNVEENSYEQNDAVTMPGTNGANGTTIIPIDDVHDVTQGSQLFAGEIMPIAANDITMTMYVGTASPQINDDNTDFSNKDDYTTGELIVDANASLYFVVEITNNTGALFNLASTGNTAASLTFSGKTGDLDKFQQAISYRFNDKSQSNGYTSCTDSKGAAQSKVTSFEVADGATKYLYAKGGTNASNFFLYGYQQGDAITNKLSIETSKSGKASASVTVRVVNYSVEKLISVNQGAYHKPAADEDIQPGDVIQYRINIKNLNDESALTLKVTDTPSFSNISNPDGTLYTDVNGKNPIGETVTINATKTLSLYTKKFTVGQQTGGNFVNTVRAELASSSSVYNEDSVTIPVGEPSPRFTVTKEYSIDGGAYSSLDQTLKASQIGKQLAFRVTIENTGTFDLDLMLEDEFKFGNSSITGDVTKLKKLGDATNAQVTSIKLPVGQYIVLESIGSYTIPSADLANPKKLVNTVTATDKANSGEKAVSSTVTLTIPEELKIDKTFAISNGTDESADGFQYSAFMSEANGNKIPAGDTAKLIKFQISFTNTSSEALTIQVTDTFSVTGNTAVETLVMSDSSSDGVTWNAPNLTIPAKGSAVLESSGAYTLPKTGYPETITNTVQAKIENDTVQDVLTLKPATLNSNSKYLGYSLSISGADFPSSAMTKLDKKSTVAPTDDDTVYEVKGSYSVEIVSNGVTASDNAKKYVHNDTYTEGTIVRISDVTPVVGDGDDAHTFLAWYDKQAKTFYHPGDFVSKDDREQHTLDAIWAVITSEGNTRIYDGKGYKVTANDVDVTGEKDKYDLTVVQARFLGSTEYYYSITETIEEDGQEVEIITTYYSDCYSITKNGTTTYYDYNGGAHGEECTLYSVLPELATRTNVGTYTYTIYAKLNTPDGNSTTVSTTSELIITPRPLTIRVASSTYAYDGAKHKVKVSDTNNSEYTASGFVSTDKIDGTVDVVYLNEGVSAEMPDLSEDDYDTEGQKGWSTKDTSYVAIILEATKDAIKLVNAAGEDVTKNYEITVLPGTLTIVKPDWGITKEVTQIVHGATCPTDSNNTVAHVGDTVKYTITVTNNGEYTLTGDISDTLTVTNLSSESEQTLALTFDASRSSGASYSAPKLTLNARGDYAVFTAEYPVAAGDDKLVNVATVGGVPSEEVTTTVERIEWKVVKEAVSVDCPNPAPEEENHGNHNTNGAGKPIAHVGDTVNYKITVTNTGNTKLENLVLTDTLTINDTKTVHLTGFTLKTDESTGATGTAANFSIEKGGKAVFSVSHTVAATDAKLENVATVSGEDSDTVTTDVEQTPKLSITKNVTSQTHNPVEVNDVITYAIVVENPGNMDLTSVEVSDDLEGVTITGITSTVTGRSFDFAAPKNVFPYTIAPLAIGEKVTFTVSYTVKQSDIDAGETLTNTAKVEADDPRGGDKPKLTDEDDATVNTNHSSKFNATKTVAGLYQNGAVVTSYSGGYKVGDIVAFKIVVQNTGTATLKNVTVSENKTQTGLLFVRFLTGSYTEQDDVNDESTATATVKISEIAPGASVTVTVLFTVTDIANAKPKNITTVTNPDDPDDPKTPSAEVDRKSWTVAKTVSGMSGTGSGQTQHARVGDTLVYTITVVNTGDVKLTNLAVDDKLNGTGLTWADLGAELTIKNTAGSSAPSTTNYTGEALTLEVGQTAVIVYEVEVEAGTTYENVVLVSDDPNDTDEDHTDTTTTEVEDWEISKARKTITRNGQIVDKIKVGDVVTYTITVKNNGSVDLTLKLADVLTVTAQAGTTSTPSVTWNRTNFNVEGDDFDNTTIKLQAGAPGNERTFDVSYTVGDNDVFLSNVAKAGIGTEEPKSSNEVKDIVYVDVVVLKEWQDGDGKSLDNKFKGEITINLYAGTEFKESVTLPQLGQWSHTFENLPGYDTENGQPILYYVKESNGTSDVEINGTITVDDHTFTVVEGSYTDQDTNTANYRFKVVNKLTDDQPGDTEKKADQTTDLEIGNTITYTITRTSHLAGTSVAKITDTLPVGLTFDADNADVKVEIDGVEWQKTSAATPEGNVYTQTTDGNAKTGTTLEWMVYNVPPMAEVVITYTVKVTVDAVTNDNNGELTNTASVGFGTSPDGSFNEKTDDEKVTVLKPNLSITKTAKVGDTVIDKVKPGMTFDYVLTVSNSGEGHAEHVVVEDVLPEGLNLSVPADAEHDETTGTDTWKVGNDIVVFDGSTITWTVARIEANDGTATLTLSVTVADDLNESSTPVKTIQNTATIIDGDRPKDDPESDDAEVDVVDFTVVKKATLPMDETQDPPEQKAVASLGDVITYTITITNIGNVKLENLVVEDTMFSAKVTSGVTYRIGSGNETPVTLNGGKFTIPALGAGEIAIVTYTYTVTEDDINEDNIPNTVTVTAKDPTDPFGSGTIEKKDKKEVETEEPDRSWMVEKDVAGLTGLNETYARVGDVLTYTIKVTNTGNVTLETLNVTDKLTNAPGGAALTKSAWSGKSEWQDDDEHDEVAAFADGVITNLHPGETMIITYTYTVQQSDMGDKLTNVATADMPNSENPNPPSGTTTTPVENWEVTKEVGVKENDVWRKLNEGESVPAGTTVFYHVVIKNTSDHELGALKLTDTFTVGGVKADQTYVGLTSTVSGSGTTFNASTKELSGLAVGETVTLEFSYDVKCASEDTDEGKTLINVASVSGGPESKVTTVVDKFSVAKSVKTLVDNGIDNAKIAVPGQTLTYTITVTNEGDTTIEKLTVADKLNDASFDLTNATVVREPATSQADFDSEFVTNLGPNEVIKISYEYTVPVKPNEIPNNLANVVTVTNGDNDTKTSGTDTPVGKWSIDKALTKVEREGAEVEGKKPVAGDVLTYIITVTNDGEVTLNDLVISDVLTGGTGSAKPTYQNMEKEVGSTVTFENGKISGLAKGETVSLIYTYTVQPGDMYLVNTATASKGGHDESNNEKTVIYIKVVVRKAWLAGDEKALDSALMKDITITLYRKTANTDKQQVGTATATSTSNPSWKVNFGIQPATTDGGEPYIYSVEESWNGGTVTDDVITIGDYKFDVEIAEDRDASPNYDFTITNKLKTGTPEKPEKKNDRTANVQIGETITYTVSRKSHLSTTSEATITDKLPAGLDFEALVSVEVSVDGTTWSDRSDKTTQKTPVVSTTGTVLEWTIKNVPPMATVKIEYKAKVNGEAINANNSPLVNSAEVSFDHDGNGDFDPATSTVEVNKPELSIKKTANVNVVKPGDKIEYTLKVTNSGDGRAMNVVVVDTLPEEGVTLDLTSFVKQPDGTYLWTINDTDKAVYSETDRTITWTIGVIEANGNAELKLTVTVGGGWNEETKAYDYLLDSKGGFINSLLNKAKITDGMPKDQNGDPIDPDPEDDKNPYEDQVETPVADLFIDKEGEDVYGDVGGTVGELYHPDDKITYTIKVENVGNVDLTDVKVTDNMFPVAQNKAITVVIRSADGTSSVPKVMDGTSGEITIPELKVGDIATITYIYVITEDDIKGPDKISNTATTWGTYEKTPGDPSDTEQTNKHSDTEDMPADAQPSMTVVKMVEGMTGKDGDRDYAVLGDKLTYTVTVKNTGNVALSNVVVKDEMFGLAANGVVMVSVDDKAAEPYQVTNNTITISELPRTKSAVITYSYTVVEKDIVNGHILNTVTVNAKDHYGDPVGPEEDSKDVDTDEMRSELGIAKRVAASSKPKNGKAFTEGETIRFEITVTNTGNVSRMGDVIDEMMAGAIFEAGKGYEVIGGGKQAKITKLEPNSSLTLTAVYTVRQQDIVNGGLENVVVAGGGATPTPGPDHTPAPGATPSPTPRPSASVQVTPEKPVPEFTITKNIVNKPANGVKYVLNETIEYEIIVKNTGNVDLTNVTIDDQLRNVVIANSSSYTITKNGVMISSLPKGATVTIKASYVVTEADILNGSVENVAVGSATGPSPDTTPTPDPSGKTPTPGTTATPIPVPDPTPGVVETDTVPRKGHLTIEKVVTNAPASGDGYALGETITYNVTVINDGNLTITNVTVTDLLTGGRWTLASLKPGERKTFATSYVVTEADILAGSVLNAATAKGTSPDPEQPDVPVEPDEVESKTEPKKGHLTVEKTVTNSPANSKGYGLGETITYAVTVINDGNLTITDIVVTDELTGNEWKLAYLKPGERVTYTTSYVVTIEDVLAGSVLNVATAKGTSPDPDEPEVPTTPSEVKSDTTGKRGHLTVTKVVTNEPVDGVAYALGETITYEIRVINDGNLTLTNIVVTDELTGGRWTIASLAPRESRYYTTAYVVTQADVEAGRVVNVATAKGTSPDPEHPDVSDDSDEVISQTKDTPPSDPTPTYQLTKTATNLPARGYYAEGETVIYNINVLNTGSVAIIGFTLTDQLAGTTVLPGTGYTVKSEREALIDRLRPGQSVDVKVSYTVTKEDVKRGSIRNVANGMGAGSNGKTPSGNVTEITVPTNEKTYKVTVHYYYLSDGTHAAPDQVQSGLKPGDGYEFQSPTIDGFWTTTTSVSGTMPAHDVEVTVFYVPNSVVLSDMPGMDDQVRNGMLLVILDEYGTPLSVGSTTRNVGDCFE